ncbi:MAG TPA: sodium/solute symporter [Candidatus Saccharimonadales bacterium]|nr:sodium/solute symporter [Candidatus Saccharimonadales bacterium]
MPDYAQLNVLDFGVFLAYVLILLGLGLWVGRRGHRTARGYFLGDKKIPWYVVGASMVAADISSEHFIANVGGAYQYGVVLAAGSWNTWIIYSLLIWIFLPYYVRTGLYTMPEFLERRYNPLCRYIFALVLVIGYVAAIIAGSLYAGGIALESVFGLNVLYGIVFFALAAGLYTIYGGLKAAAWTDFLQMIVLLGAGVLVPILALRKAGSLLPLVNEFPEKFQMFHSPSSKPFPFTGVFTGFLTVGIWYSCTSQHIVQRVLGAKDEWNARMGVVCAGFLHIITPFFFILPGIAAFKLFPHLQRPDQAYLVLVKTLVPAGFKGLILAAMAGALMSTLSTVLNSTSTILTMDLYKKWWNPRADETQQVRFGRWSGALALAASVAVAFGYAASSTPLFVKIQNVFFYIAPPFAVVFTLGLLWRRANAAGAVSTICAGFFFTWLLDAWLFPHVAMLGPYNTYLHRAFLAWLFCMAVMVVVSLGTSAPATEKTRGIIWSPHYAALPPQEQARYHGWKDFRIWWLLFVSIILSIYGFFIWFRLRHPW